MNSRGSRLKEVHSHSEIQDAPQEMREEEGSKSEIRHTSDLRSAMSLSVAPPLLLS